MAITLPHRFDTRSVWRTIVGGAFALNAVLLLGVAFTLLVARDAARTLGLVVVELVVLWFTRLLLAHQEGSAGTLSADRVDVEPNVLLGIPLPGPQGTYALDRFRAVRVEFHSGRTEPGVQGGPHEVVRLVGRPGTPDVVIARTDDRAGRPLGRELGALLGLPVEETGEPRNIRL